MTMKHYKYVCPKCGGDEVGWDANACWNPVTREQCLLSTFDNEWCNECGDVHLKKVAIKGSDLEELLVEIELNQAKAAGAQLAEALFLRKSAQALGGDKAQETIATLDKVIESARGMIGI